MDQGEDGGSPFMNFSTLLEEIFPRRSCVDVVTIVTSDGLVLEMQTDASRRTERNLVAYRGRVIPLVITGFVVGVNIELSIKREVSILLLVVLVAENVGERSRMFEVGERVV
jgi:hypothetical protein